MAVVQMVMPLVLCYCVAVILKTRGGYGWTSAEWSWEQAESLSSANEIWSVSVLSPLFYRSMFGFFSWWLVATLFLFSMLGTVYSKTV